SGSDIKKLSAIAVLFSTPTNLTATATSNNGLRIGCAGFNVLPGMDSTFCPFIGKINGNLTDYGFKITADFCISESKAISFVPNVTTTSLDGVCSFFYYS
ncbi:MAG: hypothetical protein MK411_11875, partial [SAR202 cluster bacterium]|nr:hypothetical protein [SAR202 cluster bacterium]